MLEGLAVSMKLEHAINGLKGVATGISNGISLLQIQDGALETIGSIISRIGELRSMYDDVSKSSTDQTLYDNELDDLAGQLRTFSAANGTTFNGVDLFSGDTSTNVQLDTSGSNSVSLTLTDLSSETSFTALSGTTGGAARTFATDASQTEITAGLNKIAELSAGNGGEANSLQFALADVNSQIANLTAANGRIVDVDIAAESANLAKQQILVQASAAMVAQANTANNVALVLLQ